MAGDEGLPQAFPFISMAFPRELMEEVRTRHWPQDDHGNKPASGTEIIKETGRRATFEPVFHRIYLGRQCFPDRRMKIFGIPIAEVLPDGAKLREKCSMVPIKWAA